MKFLKETTSYRLVTYLERFQVRDRYFNIVLFMYHFIKFYCVTKYRILRKCSNREKMDLFIRIFKERFYLNQLKTAYNLEEYNYSTLNYNTINNIIICDINYDSFNLYIEYGLMDNKYSIYISTKDKKFNLSEQNLINENLYELYNITINLIFLETCTILYRLFYIHIKKFLESIFNKER